MSKLNTLAAIVAHQFSGHFSADSAAMQSVYAFAENESQPIADRADALRHLAVHGFGFDGQDAGENVPDQEFVDQYMNAR
jgi:hypothetical protein